MFIKSIPFLCNKHKYYTVFLLLSSWFLVWVALVEKFLPNTEKQPGCQLLFPFHLLWMVTFCNIFYKRMTKTSCCQPTLWTLSPNKTTNSKWNINFKKHGCLKVLGGNQRNQALWVKVKDIHGDDILLYFSF